MLRWLVALWLVLACGAASAQEAPGAAPGLVRAARSPLPPLRPGRPERFARTAAWVGILNGGLLLSGAVAIAVVDNRASEPVTRSVHLGLTALSAPLVALSSWTVRRRTRLKGVEAVRKLGWAAYAGAIAFGVGELYGTINDAPSSPTLTVVSGVLAAVSVLPHAFDAYVCARQSHVRNLWFRISPLGIAGGF